MGQRAWGGGACGAWGEEHGAWEERRGDKAKGRRGDKAKMGRK